VVAPFFVWMVINPQILLSQWLSMYSCNCTCNFTVSYICGSVGSLIKRSTKCLGVFPPIYNDLMQETQYTQTSSQGIEFALFFISLWTLSKGSFGKKSSPQQIERLPLSFVSTTSIFIFMSKLRTAWWTCGPAQIQGNGRPNT